MLLHVIEVKNLSEQLLNQLNMISLQYLHMAGKLSLRSH